MTDNKTEAKDRDILKDSEVTGTTRHTKSAAEEVRSKNNRARDSRTVLGRCFPAEIVVE